MTTPSQLRLFIAAEIPEAFRSACASLIEAFGPSIPSARWVRPEGIHLTFKFLGATDARRLAAISEAIVAPARIAAPFEFVTGAPGFFGSRSRPRVFWIAVEGDVEAAERLAESLEAAMEPFGFERENRPYRPHLTLARFETEHPTSLPEGLIVQAEALAGARIPVDSLVLLQSLPGRGGSRYIPQARFPLDGRPT